MRPKKIKNIHPSLHPVGNASLFHQVPHVSKVSYSEISIFFFEKKETNEIDKKKR